MKAKYSKPSIIVVKTDTLSVIAGTMWEGGAKQSNKDFDEPSTTDDSWDEDM